MNHELAPLQYTFKVASRCNLNCRYCYVYNKADDSWASRPAFMSDEVVLAAARRIREHCRITEQRTVNLLFHGGEPCLVGVERFRRWCELLREQLTATVRPRFILQTNATLLNDGWLKLILEEGVNVGISLDGPEELHDRERVDHKGRGSYRAVVAGIEALNGARIPFAILAVVSLGSDGALVHRHLAGFRPTSVDYIMPDFTHDSIAAVHASYGGTPCADFLIPAFDEWWRNGTLDLAVSPFTHIARAILGGSPRVDFIGNNPLGYVFIEADGTIEGLDVLKVCSNGLTKTGINVFEHDFAELGRVSRLHSQAIFEGIPLPTQCGGCLERETCAGGYLPHRYSRARRFDNPSVWCRDLLALFQHIRLRFGVDHEETEQRRLVLAQMANEGPLPVADREGANVHLRNA
jgi:uncharacterized protein